MIRFVSTCFTFKKKIKTLTALLIIIMCEISEDNSQLGIRLSVRLSTFLSPSLSVIVYCSEEQSIKMAI